MEAIRSIPKDIEWAEGYVSSDYLLLHTTDRMEKYCWASSIVYNGRRYTDTDAFLAEFGRMVGGREVIVALGDSNSAGYVRWPRRLARELGVVDEVAVLNLADFDHVVDQHALRLERVMALPELNRASKVTAVYVGGLVDVERRVVYYEDFIAGRRSSPFLQSETELAEHRFGAEIARLLRRAPADREDARRWIGRRTLAATKVLERICTDAGHRFLGVVQPLCYPDLSPGYSQAMRALYERQANGEPFEVWRRNLGWSLDADERFNLQLRSYLDEFRELWHREGVRTDVSRYLDAAALFQGITGTTYEISPKFDAVHYNDAGSDLIARTVLAICRREASQPSATA